MADRKFTDSTGKWEPLKDYLWRRGISRHGPMRAGDPIGEYRFDNLFALERELRPIRVRGYPKEIIGEPQLLPPGELYGYLVDDRGEGRLIHVASGVTWYAVEVLEAAAATASRVTPPAPVPSVDAPAVVKSVAEEPPQSVTKAPDGERPGGAPALAQLKVLLETLGRTKEEPARLAAVTAEIEFVRRQWRIAWKRNPSKNKIKPGHHR
jgi:hypothetical protein